MKPIIIDMKEMSDSTEVYGTRPHPFFVIFIYMILGMMAAAFAWMYFWKLDVVVKSNGTFKMEEMLFNVSSSATGMVKECSLSEGEYVQAGDVLVCVEHGKEDASLEIYEKQLSDTNDRLAMMNAYMKYLEQGEDEMSALSQNQYYSEFANRKEILSVNKQMVTTDYDNQVLVCQQNISSINKSIEYYQGQKDKYTKELENAESTQSAVIEQQIVSIEGNLLTLNGSLEEAKSQLLSVQNGTKNLSAQNAILTEKNLVASELLTYESKKAECESNIETLKSYIAKCDIKAETDGYISVITQLKTGDYVQEGTAICRIIPKESDSYYAEVYISNQDIGKIEVGQAVKFEIATYPSSEYGYFTGTVETISRDIKVDQSTGSAFYLAKIKCDAADLHNKNGDSVHIMNGMACQAKVITDEQSVLEYVLEKIDLLGE